MLSYPIDIKQISSDTFRAIWVDFPDFPQGRGKGAQEAFDALIDSSFGAVADFVASGRAPQPSVADGRPCVTFEPPKFLSPPHIGRLISITPSGTAMKNYSWTNGATYVE